MNTAKDIRHQVTLRHLLHRYLPRLYLRQEIERVRESPWLTDQEKEDRIWVLKHTVPVGRDHRE